MEPRTMKRKRYEVVKNDVSVELTKLTNDSRDFNNDIQNATEDFEAMFKSMRDRQNDFLSRSLLLEENYGSTIRVLDDKAHNDDEESGGENEVLPRGYAEDIMKFINDSRASLNSHGLVMATEYEAMENLIKQYTVILQQNVKELRVRAELIAKQRTKLSSKLSVFSRTEVEYSESD